MHCGQVWNNGLRMRTREVGSADRIAQSDARRKDAWLASLGSLDLSEEVYRELQHSQDFLQILGVAFENPDKLLSFFEAEVEYYERKKLSRESGSVPTGRTRIEFEHNTFAQDRELLRSLAE